MVKHIVFFKLENNSDENKEIVRAKLLTMKEKIDILRNIEVGINFAQEDRAYDLALLTDFNDQDALKNYAIHPYHLEIIAFMKQVTLSSKVVDYYY